MTRRQRAKMLFVPCSVPYPDNDNDSYEALMEKIRVGQAAIDALEAEAKETFAYLDKLLGG